MESIGERLMRVREARNFTTEQVARETHISQKYIEAIEGEMFDVFPGETYLLGFLRKYAEHLGVSSQDAVNLYRNQKLQEQPAPIEELLNPKSSFPVRPVLIGAAVAVILLGIGIVAALLPENKQADFAVEQAMPEEKAEFEADPDWQQRAVYLRQDFIEQRFFPGDVVAITVNDQDYLFLIKEISDAVHLDLGERGARQIAFGSAARLDMTGDGNADLVVRVSPRQVAESAGTGQNSDQDALQETAGPEDGAVLRISRSLEGPERAASRPGMEPVSYAEPIGDTRLESRRREPLLIRESSLAGPIRVDVTADSSPVMVRLVADDQKISENMLRPGGSLALEGEQYVQLYVANAGAVNVRVNNEAVSIGKDGQVSVVRFAWNNIFGPGNPRL
ncbi:MAG: DUF4115 domain-containing protein, partial [Spirochaetaceae bacterium]